MKIHVLDYKEILNKLPEFFDLNFLDEYLNGGRQDVLDNVDIFCENVRTINLKEKNFSLFEKVPYINDEVILVFSFYLELFEFVGQHGNIPASIEYLSNTYPNNKIVVFWNHDSDFVKYIKFAKKNPNLRVINYNTSHQISNDIVVPFWTMGDLTPIKEEKKTFCSFIGSVNNQLRHSIVTKICNHENYLFSFNLSPEEYRKKISESVFNLCPRGQGLSSYRFFECFHANTIPVLFADDVVLPYSDSIDYTDICVRIPEMYASNFEYVDNILKNINTEKMYSNISNLRNRFTLEGVQNYVYSKI